MSPAFLFLVPDREEAGQVREFFKSPDDIIKSSNFFRTGRPAERVGDQHVPVNESSERGIAA
jgi:hypothetical protein